MYAWKEKLGEVEEYEVIWEAVWIVYPIKKCIADRQQEQWQWCILLFWMAEIKVISLNVRGPGVILVGGQPHLMNYMKWDIMIFNEYIQSANSYQV